MQDSVRVGFVRGGGMEVYGGGEGEPIAPGRVGTSRRSTIACQPLICFALLCSRFGFGLIFVFRFDWLHVCLIVCVCWLQNKTGGLGLKSRVQYR